MGMVPISGRMGNGQAQVANPPLEHTPDVRRPAAQRLRSTALYLEDLSRSRASLRRFSKAVKTVKPTGPEVEEDRETLDPISEQIEHRL